MYTYTYTYTYTDTDTDTDKMGVIIIGESPSIHQD